MSRPRALPAVLGLAIVLRLAVAIALGDRAEPVSGAADQVSYDVLAERVRAGHGFSFPTPWYPFTEADRPTAHWSFVYTLYLAAVYTLVGHHPLAARVVQAVASSTSCWFVYRIGTRLFGTRVGLAGAAITA
ncbi:MAG: glycosyltransferase family 39 protein, partial [Candidatus Binatia bacterium]